MAATNGEPAKSGGARQGRRGGARAAFSAFAGRGSAKSGLSVFGYASQSFAYAP